MLTVLMVVAVLSILGPALLAITLSGYDQSMRATKSRQAYLSAAGGVETALADIRANPQASLVNGKTWKPDPTAPTGLDFRTTLSAGAQANTYLLTSLGGPVASPTTISMMLTATTGSPDPLTPYVLAMGTDLALSSTSAVSVQNGPAYIEGNLSVTLKSGSYPFSNAYPVVVSGTAMFRDSGPWRTAVAADLGASTLTVGSAPIGVNAAIDAVLGAAQSGAITGATAYDDAGWGTTYNKSAKRLVYSTSAVTVKNAGPITLYGRLVVGGTLTLKGSTALVVYGALDAKNLAVSKDSSIRIEYRPDLIPPSAQSLVVSSWQVTR